MSFPINGRIAIIDDQITQVLPLIKVLSKKQYPFSYFSGELKYLPEEESLNNDYRIIFLDINLIDDSEHPSNTLKARLIPVLRKIISKNNFPFVIIFWSRHQVHYDLIKEIFENELKDRKPIGFIQEESKGDYFDLEGKESADIVDKIDSLFYKVDSLLNDNKAFDYLLNWENQVHKSTDSTLQEIFSSYHQFEDWANNANFLINKMGESYAGKSTYKSQAPNDKIKSAYLTFNNVFFDTLEYSTNNSQITNAVELICNVDRVNSDTIFTVNKKLLVSDESDIMEYSGTVTEDTNPKTDKIFQDLLNNSFNRRRIEDIIKGDPTNAQRAKNELDKMINSNCSDKRREIRQTWRKLYFVTTPLCDYVQRKCYNIRVVKGMLIKAEFQEFIDEKSEAIFVSPRFKFESEVYIIVLHFRYFFTSNGSRGILGLKPLFRARQNLLAEVQSKLARHCSRQGIIYLEI